MRSDEELWPDVSEIEGVLVGLHDEQRMPLVEYARPEDRKGQED